MAPSEPRPYSTMQVVAGRPGGRGNVDGIGTAARLDTPTGLALDGSGNLYIAMWEGAMLRKMALATGEVSTVAGIYDRQTGLDGIGTAATLNYPSGLSLDGGGSLYIADSGGHTLRRMFLANYQVLTAIGQHEVPGSRDDQGTAARLNSPGDVLIDSLHNTYISDTANHTIRRVDPSGLVSTLAGTAGQPGSVDDVGAAARFNRPGGLAQDSLGNLYIADTENQLIRRLDPQTGRVTTVAGSTGSEGLVDGVGRAARFSYPAGLAFDGQGALFIADRINLAIRRLDLGTGMVTTLAGGGGYWSDGVGSEAGFDQPSFLAYDRRDGSLYISDTHNHAIRRLEVATRRVSTVAGTPHVSTRGVVPGSVPIMSRVGNIVVDGHGTAYVSDPDARNIRKIVLATGQMSIWVGDSLSLERGAADGIGTSARFVSPVGLALDNRGNLWVADQGDHTIRRVELDTARVTTIAGSAGSPGIGDNWGLMAKFYYPTSLAMDSDRTLYITEGESAAVRQLNIVTGEVSTLAGEPRIRGHVDGIGRDARFGSPFGLAYDPRGLLYVSDPQYRTVRRVVLATRHVGLLAGRTDTFDSADGVGPAAGFAAARQLAFDSVRQVLYVTDEQDRLVRRISLPDGNVTTPLGTRGLYGLKTGGLPGSFARPGALSMAPDGSLIIWDEQEFVVLQVR